MNVIIISNGHGEDIIACNIAKALQDRDASVTLSAYPLVGEGHSYTALNIPVKTSNTTFPSGGFIRSVKDIYRDLSQGLLAHIKYQRSCIKKAAKTADLVIAIGDIFCLWQARNSAHNTIFFPTAKSDTFMPHSMLEKRLIRRFSSLVFPRDTLTTESLKKAHINTQFHGNPMMDRLLDSNPLDCPTPHPIIGILPGSRDEAYENLAYISKIISRINTPVTPIAAISPSLDMQKLSAITNIAMTHSFKPLINQARIIIGLAGTANEQAAFLGKPVLCFPGSGPQSTPTRFQEQQKLMGPNIHFHNTQDSSALAHVAEELLKKSHQTLPTEPQNAASKIADSIATHIQKTSPVKG